MVEVILSIGVASFIIYAAFSIAYIISMKRTSETTRDFLKNTEADVKGTLAELKGTLENMRKISGDVSSVTTEVRQISDTVAGLDKGIRDLYEYLKRGLGAETEANLAGLRAGITTGVTTLIQNLKEKGSDDHEGRTGK